MGITMNMTRALACGVALIGAAASLALGQSASLVPFTDRVEAGADAGVVKPRKTHFAYDVMLDPGPRARVVAGTLHVDVVGPGRLWHASDQALGANGVLTAPAWGTTAGSSRAYDTYLGGLRDGGDVPYRDARIAGSAVASGGGIYRSGSASMPIAWGTQTGRPGQPASAGRLTFLANPGYVVNLEGRGEVLARVRASMELYNGRLLIEFPMTVLA